MAEEITMPLPEEIAPFSPIEKERIHTSLLLRGLIDSATEDHFTLGWLIKRLPNNSFGVIMLFLSLMSLLPVISIPARILFLFLAMQIILGFRSPMLPQRLLNKKLPTRYLAYLNRHAIPALEKLERTVRPRWAPFLFGIRRFTATVAVLLTILSLIVPLPLINIPPAIVSAFIALAYIEHDGLLLLFGLILALTMLASVAVTAFVY